MPLNTILIKPASSLCSMQCRYCFYCDEAGKREQASYGMMTETTLRNIIKKMMFQAEREICFAFQGGEPTLRGTDFFWRALEFEQRFNRNHVQVRNVLQTNGLQIDEEWCRLFKEGNFLVGVSVDGTKAIHDSFRHDRAGEGTYDRICGNIRLLEEYGIEYNILTVVTAQSAEHIGEIYREYKRKGWNYQQYIICLDPLGEEPGKSGYSLTPELYGAFLVELFEMWYKDWKRGRVPYIRQFENYIGILMGYPPESCEQRGVCSVQCVTEADGSVYPCDFYVLDEYRLGSFNEDKVKDFFENRRAADFVKESRIISDSCAGCEWYPLCRGGCRRHRVMDDKAGAYHNYFCEGYRLFFERCGGRLREIADYLKK